MFDYEEWSKKYESVVWESVEDKPCLLNSSELKSEVRLIKEDNSLEGKDAREWGE